MAGLEETIDATVPAQTLLVAKGGGKALWDTRWRWPTSPVANGFFQTDANGVITVTATAVTDHDLLSADHPDTVAASPVRGDVIVGNATPAWARLAIGGAATFLRSDGTDPSWQAIVSGDLPSHTHAASDITTGTFGSGNYTFPNNVTVQGTNLTITNVTNPGLSLDDTSVGTVYTLTAAGLDFVMDDGSGNILKFTGGDWDFQSKDIKAAQTLESNIATGTAPLIVASTTVVANLNADLLDGNHASAFSLTGHAHDTSDITTGILPIARGGTGNSDIYSTSNTWDINQIFARGLVGQDAIDVWVTGDIDYRLTVFADGKHEWGDGTNPRDTNLYRDAASILATDDQLKSTVATGTAPLIIASTTLVSNLNADQLDSQQGTYYLARTNHTGTQLKSTISDFAHDINGADHTGTLGIAKGGTGNSDIYSTSNTWDINQIFARGLVGQDAIDVWVTGDIDYRLTVFADGKHEWGDGTNPRDTNLYRSAASVLKTDDNFDALALRIGGTEVITSARNMTNVGTIASGAITASGDIELTGAGSDLILADGNFLRWGGASGDTRIYGTAASDLITFVTGGSERVRIVGSNVLVGTTVDGGELFQVNGTADFTGNLTLTGAALAVDETPSAAGSAVIKGPLRIHRTSPNASAIEIDTSGDIDYPFVIYEDGKLEWGNSNDPRDTNVFRSAANVLKTDDNFDALALRIGGTEVITFARNMTNIGTIASGAITVSAAGAISSKIAVRASDSLESYQRFQNSTTGTSNSDGLVIGIDSGENAIMWHQENENISFATNNLERMRITAGGNIFINDTTDVGARFAVKETTAEAEIMRLATTDTGNPSERTFQGGIQTSDATTTTIVTLATSSNVSYQVVAHVIGVRLNGADEVGSYVLTQAFNNDAGTLTAIGTADKVTHEEQAGYDATLTVSGTNILVRVTGIATHTMNWTCTARVWTTQ